MLMGDVAQGRQEIRVRRDAAHVAHDRLHNHAGNGIAMRSEQIPDGLHVVEGQGDGVRCGREGHARALRQAERRHA